MTNVRSLLEQGLAHHRAGRRDEAEGFYRRALEAEPENANGLHLLGVCALEAGRNEEGADLIGRAVARNPKNANMRVHL